MLTQMLTHILLFSIFDCSKFLQWQQLNSICDPQQRKAISKYVFRFPELKSFALRPT